MEKSHFSFVTIICLTKHLVWVDRENGPSNEVWGMWFILFSQPPPSPSEKLLTHSSETSWFLANYYGFTYLQIASFPSFDILIPMQLTL